MDKHLPSCSKQELFSRCVQASRCCDFSCCGAWVLDLGASEVAAQGLRSCGVEV